MPGDPSNDAILSATPAFGGIDVTWNYPSTNPQALAYTKLYRGLTDSFDSAILIREVAGSFYYDKLDTATRYYYWIRFVSVNGTIGELIGPASAIAKPTIEGMIELLTGQIDAGLLATSLKNQLDQISILNDQLLEEIFDRQGDQVSLAQAIQDANDGVAASHTFLIQAINDLTTADAAIVEQINGVAATLDDTYGAVIETMSVQINGLTGTVNAMWTAQVNVNGLVGGFGIINDGLTVQAGFDVDEFWIGRTSTDGRKPFILGPDGIVYIDQAAIYDLTFTKLRDESGSFIVEDGKVKADYLEVGTAVINDLSVTTAKIANLAVTTAKIDSLAVKTAQIDNLAVTSGKIANLAVDTLQIAGNAVTIPASDTMQGNGTSLSSTPATLCSVVLDFAGNVGTISVIAEVSITATSNSGSVSNGGVTLFRDGQPLRSFSTSASSVSGGLSVNRDASTFVIKDGPFSGSHTYTIVGTGANAVVNTCSMVCIGTKK